MGPVGIQTCWGLTDGFSFISDGTAQTPEKVKGMSHQTIIIRSEVSQFAIFIHGGGEYSDDHPRHGHLGDDPDGGPFSSQVLIMLP